MSTMSIVRVCLFELGFVMNFVVQFYDVNEVALFWYKLMFNNCGSLMLAMVLELHSEKIIWRNTDL